MKYDAHALNLTFDFSITVLAAEIESQVGKQGYFIGAIGRNSWWCDPPGTFLSVQT